MRERRQRRDRPIRRDPPSIRFQQSHRQNQRVNHRIARGDRLPVSRPAHLSGERPTAGNDLKLTITTRSGRTRRPIHRPAAFGVFGCFRRKSGAFLTARRIGNPTRQRGRNHLCRVASLKSRVFNIPPFSEDSRLAAPLPPDRAGLEGFRPMFWKCVGVAKPRQKPLHVVLRPRCGPYSKRTMK